MVVAFASYPHPNVHQSQPLGESQTILPPQLLDAPDPPFSLPRSPVPCAKSAATTAQSYSCPAIVAIEEIVRPPLHLESWAIYPHPSSHAAAGEAAIEGCYPHRVGRRKRRKTAASSLLPLRARRRPLGGEGVRCDGRR